MQSIDTDNGKSQGRGRSNSLPAHVVDYLKAWLMSPEHISHPYPTEKEKVKMVADTGIELKRLNNWFVNNRIRYWKPRMEALQRQEQNSLVTGLDNGRTSSSPGVLIAPSSSSSWVAQSPTPTAVSVRFRNPVTPDTSEKSVFSLHNVSDTSTSANVSVSSGDDDNSLSEDTSPSVASGDTHQHQHQLSSNPRKRRQEEIVPATPRSKYSKQDAGLWREACLSTSRTHCTSLPTLDEAALLFGFSESP